MKKARAVMTCIALIAGLLLPASGKTNHREKSKHMAQSSPTKQAKLPHLPRFETSISRKGGQEPEANAASSAEQERYDNMAYPQAWIGTAQQQQSFKSFSLASSKYTGGLARAWQSVGPNTDFVTNLLSYTPGPGANTYSSGRVTAIAVSPQCPNSCKLLLGAAGGGVWLAHYALEGNPGWTSVNNGIGSNAIGSLVFDPNDAKGETAYAGTGEGNGSSDSEAGVGLYKTVDLGMHWTLVPGSVAVANGRAILSVAVDPANANHIYIGTAVARHGAASVNGGRFTPPGAPTIGLYESKDGGATFTLAFSVPSDTVNPTTPSGNDFFRGGITRIALDRTGLSSGQATRVFLSVYDYGVYRSLDGVNYAQIFTSPSNGSIPFSSVSRTQFAVTPRNGTVRMYVGDSGTGTGVVYRSDDVLSAAPSFTLLSNSTTGTPGYATYNFCEGQCWYDMWVEASSTNPDEVWVAGSMEYGELNAHSPSNGRAVMRSIDGGNTFTDMTDDAQSAAMWLHPDQHYVALVPNVFGVAFLGTDGGVYRTNGVFVDATSQCAARGVTGADLIDCKVWLSAIPQRLISMNIGLDTLQFQSMSAGNDDPLNDLLGGTQDNGTLAFNKSGGNLAWAETINGDGGQSGIDITNATRMHTYTGPSPDVNFFGNQTLHWDWTGDPLFGSGEAASFYVPLINDPAVSGSWFIGLQHVWRTQDNGGAQAYLDVHCDEFTGDFSVPCGDWQPLGSGTLTGSSYGADKTGGYVVALTRAPSNSSTLWTATRLGRLFITTNAAADPAAVTFTRIDTANQPRRFISGIAVESTNPNHAWVSFVGYNAYTPATPGHVFEVSYDSATSTAAWKDISYNLGDLPITGVARDAVTGNLYAATDWGVLELINGSSTWTLSAPNLPMVAVYGLTINSNARLLYAATHGRGIYRLDLSK